MSWNIGENRNLFLKLKEKLGLYHVVLTTRKKSPEKIILTLVEMQQLLEIEKVDSKNEISCLKRTIYNGSRKVFIGFKTDKLNIVCSRYRNNTYVKETEMELKLTEYEKLLSKRVYLLSYIDVFFKRCNVLGEPCWMKCIGLKKSFQHNSVRENLFPSACFCWDSRL